MGMFLSFFICLISCGGPFNKHFVLFCISTRVVQKLIETLKKREEISLVIEALEPGFISLIEDLNGNHVVQRCLQCFTTEDSKVRILLLGLFELKRLLLM